MTIIVIAGGLSHERDVSLRSGRRVAVALRKAGHHVVESDVTAELLPLLQQTDNPVVVPMLHGGLGEDGALREVLELLRVPFVGSGGAASRLTFDKSVCSPLVAAAGIATPRQFALPHDVFRELGAASLMAALGEQLGYPLIVKPARSGSALGTAKVTTPEALPSAMVGAYAYGNVAVVEEFIEGVEVSVTVIEDGDGPRALPAVEIRPESGIYDYEARYTAGSTRFITPAELPDEVRADAEQLAVKVHQLLGLRDFSRTDIIVRDEVPYFIEGNVAPGMTETSLVPLALEAAGETLAGTVGALVELARSRA